VVTDHHLVTSRKPEDIRQFNEAMIGMIAAGCAANVASHRNARPLPRWGRTVAAAVE